MKLTTIEIPVTSPFTNCKLDREKYVNTLTSIIYTYKDGFVLSINGKWGTGKTTFIKMWLQSLSNDGYKTIYFNAWENDFASEPLVAILGEIRAAFISSIELGFDSILDKASKFAGKVIPTLAKTVLTLGGFGHLADIGQVVSEATIQSFNEEISDYDQKKVTLTEFKKELSDFILKHCKEKPLVFIVDELDRCRPDYAVEVLEKIKHFFAVEGVVFILSIDKEQLSNAIKGYYGSDRINSTEYLRRFIDLEYTLPEPNYEDFAKYLYDSYGFAEFFEQSARNTKELYFDKESFFRFIERYSSQRKLSLRQLEKLFVHTKIICRMFKENNYVHPEVMFFLLALKEFHNELYSELCEIQLTIQELATRLDEVFKDFTSNIDPKFTYYFFENTFAQILLFYNLERPYAGLREESLYETDTKSGVEKLTLKLKYTNESRILELVKHRRQGCVRLSYYIKKIDLLDPLHI